MKKEGDLLLIMDGNAKLGLLGEEISRNGRGLLKIFDETDLKIVNNIPKGEGTITRKPRKNGLQK